MSKRNDPPGRRVVSGADACYRARLNPAVITRGTIWLALLCYGAAVLFELPVGGRFRKTARGVWIAGAVFFVLHLAAAFHFYHGWSHAAALDDTRRQTFERTGLNFSGG